MDHKVETEDDFLQLMTTALDIDPPELWNGSLVELGIDSFAMLELVSFIDALAGVDYEYDAGLIVSLQTVHDCWNFLKNLLDWKGDSSDGDVENRSTNEHS